MAQSLYDSVHKLEMYALIVLLEFSQYLNIATHSQYTEEWFHIFKQLNLFQIIQN